MFANNFFCLVTARDYFSYDLLELLIIGVMNVTVEVLVMVTGLSGVQFSL